MEIVKVNNYAVEIKTRDEFYCEVKNRIEPTGNAVPYAIKLLVNGATYVEPDADELRAAISDFFEVKLDDVDLTKFDNDEIRSCGWSYIIIVGAIERDEDGEADGYDIVGYIVR